MKTLYSYLSLFFFIGLFASCSDNIENRLAGEWEFQRVTSRGPATIISRNDTDQFEDLTLEFFENGDVTMYDSRIDAFYQGTYDLYEADDNRDLDGDEDYFETYIDILLIDFENDDVISFNWLCASLTNNRLRTFDRRNGRTWKYKLRKN